MGKMGKTGAQCAPLRGTNSFHRLITPSTAAAVPLPRGGRSGGGVRRSRPSALPPIGYRGFAVAPITLRAPSRKIAVITSGTNGRAMRAPTGCGGATDGCKCISPLQCCNPALQMHLTVAISRRVVGARIARPPTFCRPSIFHPKDLPLRGRGTARRRWKELSGGERRSRRKACNPIFQTRGL